MSPLIDRVEVLPEASAGDGPDRFVGWPAPGQRHVYGGLIVAQALRAACLTVAEGLLPHSLHASFLRAGREGRPLRSSVERTRDGASFATRRVVVQQDDAGPVLVLTAGFHAEETGESYQPAVDLSTVPSPEGLPPGRYDGEVFDCRDVPPVGGPPHVRQMWFRVRGSVPGDPLWHVLGVAYASDHGPTRSAREPHAGHPGVETRMSVSLDHSVWFLRPARVDQWLLSSLTPLSTGSARGLTQGTIHTADGVLVAAVTQEVLLRL